MKLDDIPEFERFDLVEIYFKDKPTGKGPESEIRYIISAGNEKNFGDYIEICQRAAGEFAVQPKKLILKHVERVVVYNRQR